MNEESTAVPKSKSFTKQVNYTGVIGWLYPGISYKAAAGYCGDLLLLYLQKIKYFVFRNILSHFNIAIFLIDVINELKAVLKDRNERKNANESQSETFHGAVRDEGSSNSSTMVKNSTDDENGIE